ncbi:MAG TPA: hypothetical protein PLS66_02480, partial [Tepiditoga sp.]|nr:hypothetical protein [Tepiditoga sp.]
MKKIKNKITLPIIVSFIILMLIIDIIIVFIFNTQIKTKFINSVSLEQKLESYGIDSNTSEIESKTESIEDYVKSTFNFERLTEEKDEYLTEYENFLEPVIKNVAETTENNDSVYIHFLPELTGNTHDIYYKKTG